MRSLVVAVAATSLSSCGPSAGTLAFKLRDRRVVRFGRGGHQADLQRQIADIRLRVIDHCELDVQLARAPFP